MQEPVLRPLVGLLTPRDPTPTPPRVFRHVSVVLGHGGLGRKSLRGGPVQGWRKGHGVLLARRGTTSSTAVCRVTRPGRTTRGSAHTCRPPSSGHVGDGSAPCVVSRGTPERRLRGPGSPLTGPSPPGPEGGTGGVVWGPVDRMVQGPPEAYQSWVHEVHPPLREQVGVQ